jgi:RNA polymerase sigma factor (sigma-70 family)
MKTERSEHALALRARDGDREALAELVERTRLRLFPLAYAELRHYEDARDAVASALVQVCLHVHELRDPAQVRAWMNSIVRNEVRHLQRAAQRRPSELLPTETLLEPALTLRLDVERALRQLPADQARALALFYLANLSIREIARRTGRPEGTIKSWLHQGRRRLAQVMEGYAPMTPTEWTAAIVSTNLEPTVLTALSDALRAAGFRRVNLFHDYQDVATLKETGEGETKEFHLPDPLKGTHLLVLDEWIGGRSAFELYPILRAAVEKREMAACILLDPTDVAANRISVFSAWVSGFDLCLNKPVQPEEFAHFAKRIRERMAT